MANGHWNLPSYTQRAGVKLRCFLQYLDECLEPGAKSLEARCLFHLQQQIGYAGLVQRRDDQGIVEGVRLAELFHHKQHTLGLRLADPAAAHVVLQVRPES